MINGDDGWWWWWWMYGGWMTDGWLMVMVDDDNDDDDWLWWLLCIKIHCQCPNFIKKILKKKLDFHGLWYIILIVGDTENAVIDVCQLSALHESMRYSNILCSCSLYMTLTMIYI